ncbi:MAG: type II toxin-antitoxin system VapC family toxin, partial [Opitutaceae bacterium]|nr:type II toxin-antitoxin system VapC family toxin [Opitutaceae bacterium]
MNVKSLYIDPSALRGLYVHEPISRRMVAWRGKLKGPLAITRFGHAELVNAIALGCFRGDFTEVEMTKSLAHVDEDFADGDLKLVDLLWRAALDKSMALSRQHAPGLGTRSMDVLHVASALELGAKHFATYDQRQARLAKACGLILIQP